jgi:hypothetical protein
MIILLIILTVIFGAILGISLNAVLRDDKLPKMFTRYEHHGATVWVRDDLRGEHRDHCLCFDCKRFHPGSAGNCKVAQATYENCIKHGIVTPVWECPTFRQDPHVAYNN